jgi:hypothetical protein
LSLWFIFDIYLKWKNESFKLFLFIGTFIFYVISTQYLVVENSQGIFFDINSFPNLLTISNFVLFESILIFLIDSLIFDKVTFKDISPYIGFASVIPWLSPAMVEGTVLLRWILEGTFEIRTFGKGLGAASLNDILFYYGYRNILYSSIIFTSFMSIFYLMKLFSIRRKEKIEKKLMLEKDKQWYNKAWNDPLILLNDKQKSSFLDSFGHLEENKQKDLLRNQILPNKGIKLIDPESVA